MRKTTVLTGWKIVLASTLAVCALILMPSSHGDGDGDGFAWEQGDGDWLGNGRADDLQAFCDANAPGTICVEWCELGGAPSGMLCCIDPGTLSGQLPGQGQMSQCQNWVPLGAR